MGISETPSTNSINQIISDRQIEESLSIDLYELKVRLEKEIYRRWREIVGEVVDFSAELFFKNTAGSWTMTVESLVKKTEKRHYFIGRFVTSQVPILYHVGKLYINCSTYITKKSHSDARTLIDNNEFAPKDFYSKKGEACR